MGFVLDVLLAPIDLFIKIHLLIHEIVLEIIDFILELLGITDQVIEYFDVQNILLFPKPDDKNPLLNVILTSVLNGSNISSALIYASAFRSLKVNIKKFMQYIEDDNYFEGFPTVESLILIIDYDELTDAVTTVAGAPATPEGSGISSLSDAIWVQYWLQENKTYDAGANILTGLDIADVVDYSTDNLVPDATVVNINLNGSDWEVDISDEILTEDSSNITDVWQVDLTGITHNTGSDTYTIPVFNDNGSTLILPYTAPTKPLQLHYISFYFINSAPARQYLFIYQVGEGTFPALDTVENPIDIDGASLQAVPAVPLRISNSNYTSFGVTKAAQIEELLDIINLDAASLLDGVLTDTDNNPGDIDNIYVNFGVRMRDTSQAAMSYLFALAENLFTTQGVTQGIYDTAPTTDAKPANNIIITTEDYKYTFQFNYISFTFTSLTTIDADSGSDENGVYYSDATKFNNSNKLVYPYYSSSFKGTYNVGFKADTLAEVALFLAGNGVVNPGLTTGEATNWMQVTTRLKYAPRLNDPDGNVSDLLYLTPDMVYFNNAGILQQVNSAAEATTAGQIITYYYITSAGLEAYTVKAPTGAWRVVDGESGVGRIVQFNLGAENDLMVPLIHTFIKDFSVAKVTQLFLAGSHISIFIAKYEVIEVALWLKVLLVVIIVIIVVISWFFPPASGALGTVGAAFTAGGLSAAAFAVFTLIIVPLIYSLVFSLVLQLIIAEVAKNDPELALILSVIAVVAFTAYNAGGVSQLNGLDYAQILITGLNNYNIIESIKLGQGIEDLEEDRLQTQLEQELKLDTLAEIQRGIFGGEDNFSDALLTHGLRKSNINAMYAEHMFTVYIGQVEGLHTMYETSALIDAQLDPDSQFI
jgi:hypothetical protein